MTIAVRAVRVMQMSGDEVIDVIAVRNAFVSAIWAVLVRCVVFRTGVPVVACRGILRIGCEGVFVHVSFVFVVEMTVVNVIDVAFMPDCGVTAIRGVRMLMFGMHGVR